MWTDSTAPRFAPVRTAPTRTVIARPGRALAAVAVLGLALLALALPAPTTAADLPEGVVNINAADAGQLALLPRVGPAVAGRIVEHREANGPFTSPEDLMLVRGIGEKTFDLVEPWVAIEGETTLTEKVRASVALEAAAARDAGSDADAR